MEMKSDAVVLHQPNELAQTVDIFSQGLVKYLDVLGLPAERVLVPVRERGVVLQNLPSVLENIPTGLRKDSLYISKFVAACGAGLFDAAHCLRKDRLLRVVHIFPMIVLLNLQLRNILHTSPIQYWMNMQKRLIKLLRSK